MSDDLRDEVEDLLYEEAELLDDRRFHQWLDLFTDDLHYWMPVRENRNSREVAEELSKPGETAFFEDTKETLRMRVARLDTGTAWAETPPSRTRHLISNIRVKGANGHSEFDVHSNFLVYRTRLDTDQDIYVGTRQDTLRRVGGQLKIARRTIILDQTILDARNISIFL